MVSCRNPNLGLVTKAKACKVASQEGSPKVKESVRNKPSHSQRSFHFGNWSPNGLQNVQRVIAMVKTQWFEEFFISLESY